MNWSFITWSYAVLEHVISLRNREIGFMTMSHVLEGSTIISTRELTKQFIFKRHHHRKP